MEKKAAYFHMVAWSLPLVLTITTMALGEIDGNSVTGICFVGNANNEYRAGFLLLPVAIALTVGSVFLFKGENCRSITRTILGEGEGKKWESKCKEAWSKSESGIVLQLRCVAGYEAWELASIHNLTIGDAGCARRRRLGKPI